MSADNGYFLFRMPDGRFGVVHHLMSGMPSEIPDIIVTGRTCMDDTLTIHDKHSDALRDAQAQFYRARADREIVEYGVVDLSDETYAEMMAPYLPPSPDGVD